MGQDGGCAAAAPIKSANDNDSKDVLKIHCGTRRKSDTPALSARLARVEMQDMRHSFDLIRWATTAHSPRVKYALHMILLMAYDLDNILVLLIDEAELENSSDWLSRL